MKNRNRIGDENMCLDNVFRNKEKEEMLAKLKDVVIGWKVLRKQEGSYVTGDRGYPVFAGENTFEQQAIRLYLSKHFIGTKSYHGGSHVFLKRESAKWWQKQITHPHERVVQVTINKADINTIGEQEGRIVIVVKKATFPKYIGGKTCVL